MALAVLESLVHDLTVCAVVPFEGKMVYLSLGSLFTKESCRIRVLLVEDNGIFSAYVSGFLTRDPRVVIIGQVQDGLDAIQSATESVPDLIVLDIGLPRMNGLQVARKIFHSFPKCRIIFLTQEGSPEFVEEAFDAGATGYVLKMRLNEDLWPAIINVCQGRRYLGSGLEVPSKIQSVVQALVTS